MTETEVQAKIIVRCFELGYKLWRNNSGVAKEEHRAVRYGLGNDSPKINKRWKSSDLIGIGPGGRMLAIECKKSDWKFTGTDRETAQHAFLLDVIRSGGIASFCRSVEEFETLINGSITL